MRNVLAFTGRAILGAASVLALFVIVLVALAVYLIGSPARRHGLAPKYQLSRAAMDAFAAIAGLTAAAKAFQETDQPRP